MQNYCKNEFLFHIHIKHSKIRKINIVVEKPDKPLLCDDDDDDDDDDDVE